MKAIRFHAYGAPSVLRLEDVATPTPREGEVLVRVAATSFNGIDAGIRGGGMQGPFPVELPHVPGIDVAGTVETVGRGVTGVEVGQRVVGFLPMLADGAAAEFVIAPAEVLTAAPADLPLADAAALPAVGLTAWQALFDHAGLRAGQRVLVNGAGGAVGDYVVQLAKRADAHVVATASARSRERVIAAGADEVVDHTSGPIAAQVTEPVDVLVQLAPIDPEAFAALVPLVADGGVIVSTTVWMPAPSDATRAVRGIDLFLRSDAGQLAELVALVDEGALRVEVAERVPLAELRSVHERAAEGGISGKVVVLVADV